MLPTSTAKHHFAGRAESLATGTYIAQSPMGRAAKAKVESPRAEKAKATKEKVAAVKARGMVKARAAKAAGKAIPKKEAAV